MIQGYDVRGNANQGRVALSLPSLLHEIGLYTKMVVVIYSVLVLDNILLTGGHLNRGDSIDHRLDNVGLKELNRRMLLNHRKIIARNIICIALRIGEDGQEML